MGKGFFITFEGVDGCGKSTQMRFLNEYLNEIGIETVVTREPGGCAISEKIRELLLSKENREMQAYTEALLYAAARVQHIEEVILPAMREGKIVLCDRYIDSSIAYQGFGRELTIEKVLEINRYAVEHCMPDATFFLEYAPEQAFVRMNEEKEHDRIESEPDAFFKRVFDGFKITAELFQERIIKINPCGSKYETHEIIKARAIALLKEKGILVHE